MHPAGEREDFGRKEEERCTLTLERPAGSCVEAEQTTWTERRCGKSQETKGEVIGGRIVKAIG